MKHWIVAILVQVVTSDDETEADAKAKVQPYADAMNLTGVEVVEAYEVKPDHG